MDSITNAKNTYIVIPPNNSKEPKPNADKAIPNKGKQQGEVNAVNIIPTTPIRSIMDVLFIILFQ